MLEKIRKRSEYIAKLNSRYLPPDPSWLARIPDFTANTKEAVSEKADLPNTRSENSNCPKPNATASDSVNTVINSEASVPIQTFKRDTRVLSLRKKEAWQELVNRLLDIHDLERLLAQQPILASFANHFRAYKKRLQKFCASPPEDFNEYTAENLTPELARLLTNFRQILESCAGLQTSPPHRTFEQALDRYFATLGIMKQNFKENDPADAWHNLSGDLVTLPATTDDGNKIGRMAKIMVQPRKIMYENNNSEIWEYNFCGKASIFCERYLSEIL